MRMSDTEKEEFSALQKDIKTIKRWIPIIIFTSGIAWGLLKIGSTAQSTYDNTIAKKEDVKRTDDKIDALTALVKSVADKHDATLAKAAAADSISKIAKNKVDFLEKQFKKLSRSVTYYSEHYSFDANGKRHVTIIPQQN